MRVLSKERLVTVLPETQPALRARGCVSRSAVFATSDDICSCKKSIHTCPQMRQYSSAGTLKRGVTYHAPNCQRKSYAFGSILHLYIGHCPESTKIFGLPKWSLRHGGKALSVPFYCSSSWCCLFARWLFCNRRLLSIHGCSKAETPTHP